MVARKDSASIRNGLDSLPEVLMSLLHYLFV